jgi:hypothetical protein
VKVASYPTVISKDNVEIAKRWILTVRVFTKPQEEWQAYYENLYRQSLPRRWAYLEAYKSFGYEHLVEKVYYLQNFEHLAPNFVKHKIFIQSNGQ